jgi:hypothetical protein
MLGHGLKINADRFLNSLFNGIDSTKAFGCGMMMIKRI